MLNTRYSATFLNGEVTSEPNSGNPGKISYLFIYFLRLVVDFLWVTDISNDRISSRKACYCWKLS